LDKRPLIYILASAALFGVSPPLAKLLVRGIPPVALAGFLYLGAFAGLFLYSFGRRMFFATKRNDRDAGLKRTDLPWLFGAVLSGGIVAPIALMLGLSRISGFTTSLLLNLEGVFTAVIAVIFFRENGGKRLWLALACMTAAGVFLAWDPGQGRFSFLGPLLVTLSMICWGIDNNLTRNISARDPMQITRIKGLVSGGVSLLAAQALGMEIRWDSSVLYALLLGSFSYGISLVFFIKALEGLGSFRTGIFFSLAPFIGAVTSLALLGEWIGWVMFPAMLLTVAGVWLISTERHSHVHCHAGVTHTHLHRHRDGHHDHDHAGSFHEPHVHEHRHTEGKHLHDHWPDTHHRHGHEPPE
jgi:drug/metabolite transporter (DMT)-like permease